MSGACSSEDIYYDCELSFLILLLPILTDSTVKTSCDFAESYSHRSVNTQTADYRLESSGKMWSADYRLPNYTSIVLFPLSETNRVKSEALELRMVHSCRSLSRFL